MSCRLSFFTVGVLEPGTYFFFWWSWLYMLGLLRKEEPDEECIIIIARLIRCSMFGQAIFFPPPSRIHQFGRRGHNVTFECEYGVIIPMVHCRWGVLVNVVQHQGPWNEAYTVEFVDFSSKNSRSGSHFSSTSYSLRPWINNMLLLIFQINLFYFLQGRTQDKNVPVSHVHYIVLK
jgi:hypothetical protein